MTAAVPPGTPVLRPARATDLPLVFRWERDYIRTVEPDAEPGWTAALERNLALWAGHLDRTRVLEADGEPAGSVMWMPDGDGALLIGVHVAPAHRRRGFGRLLLDSFAADAAAAGRTTLRLGAHRANPAIALYPAAGWTRTGTDGAYVLFTRHLTRG